MKKLSFLIVSRTLDIESLVTLKKCLSSISSSCEIAHLTSYSIILVDNGSPVQDKAYFSTIPKLKVQYLSKPKGISNGFNESFKRSDSEYVIFLNNDVLIKNNFVQILLYYIRLTKFDMIAPQLMYPNGRIQHSFAGIPTIKDVFYASCGLNKINHKFDMWLNSNFDYTKMQLTQNQPMFSAIVVPSRIWKEIGDMDLNIPIFWNDVDWYSRFLSFGYKCLYVPKLKATHYHGMTTNKSGKINKILESTRSMKYFFNKNYALTWYEKLAIIIISVYTIPLRMVRELLLIVIHT